ncbi:hypothetical protein [Rhizobium etli]|uniref:hypothetical protein n=1 Tax=Rhizobium etli TaxID=29449 RepID=UPI0012BC0EDC|nr:hypothetical protein [Rhizobium etli]
MQQLLKISSSGLIFEHFADRHADFLADPLAVAETGEGQMHPVFCRIAPARTAKARRINLIHATRFSPLFYACRCLGTATHFRATCIKP